MILTFSTNVNILKLKSFSFHPTSLTMWLFNHAITHRIDSIMHLNMCCMRQCHRPRSNVFSVCASMSDQAGSIRQIAHAVDMLALQNKLLAFHQFAASVAGHSKYPLIENVCVHRRISHGTETLNRLLSLLR